MRKGCIRWLVLTLAAAGSVCASGAMAQMPGTLAGPMFQEQMNRLDLLGYTSRLTAMGGAYIAVDDPNNGINSWSLDRNPAAMLEDVQGKSLQFYGTQDKPSTFLAQGEGDTGRYVLSKFHNRFFGMLGQAKFRNRIAAEGQFSYRSFARRDLAGEGVQVESEGNGPRLEGAYSQRIGRFFYGFSLSAYNNDESQQYIFDTTFVKSIGSQNLSDFPQLKTDRVSYHSVVETMGLQYELLDGLRLGGTLGMDQQRIDGANSNGRAQLEAINNRSLTRLSLDGIYRYRDRLSIAGRWFHTGYDNIEQFRFSRRKRTTPQDPPVVYQGAVSENHYRTRSFNARGTWQVSPRYLQLGFVYANGKDDFRRVAATGLTSYNHMDSIYLANSPAADTLGVTPAQAVDDLTQITDYVEWGVGIQLHPFPGATLVGDFTRYTASQDLTAGPRSPEVKTFRMGAEYRVIAQVALRAGYGSQLENDDRNSLVDMRQGHRVSFGLGYSIPERISVDLDYLTGNLKSDFTDPSHREIRERGLRLYAADPEKLMTMMTAPIVRAA